MRSAWIPPTSSRETKWSWSVTLAPGHECVTLSRDYTDQCWVLSCTTGLSRRGIVPDWGGGGAPWTEEDNSLQERLYRALLRISTGPSFPDLPKVEASETPREKKKISYSPWSSLPTTLSFSFRQEATTEKMWYCSALAKEWQGPCVQQYYSVRTPIIPFLYLF